MKQDDTKICPSLCIPLYVQMSMSLFSCTCVYWCVSVSLSVYVLVCVFVCGYVC